MAGIKVEWSIEAKTDLIDIWIFISGETGMPFIAKN
jgi:hypothetical protein